MKNFKEIKQENEEQDFHVVRYKNVCCELLEADRTEACSKRTCYRNSKEAKKEVYQMQHAYFCKTSDNRSKAKTFTLGDQADELYNEVLNGDSKDAYED